MERLADLDIFGFLLHLGNGSVARRGRHRFIAGIHHEKCSGDRIFLICAVVAAGAVDVRASYLSPSAAVFLLLLPFFLKPPSSWDLPSRTTPRATGPAKKHHLVVIMYFVLHPPLQKSQFFGGNGARAEVARTTPPATRGLHGEWHVDSGHGHCKLSLALSTVP